MPPTIHAEVREAALPGSARHPILSYFFLPATIDGATSDTM